MGTNQPNFDTVSSENYVDHGPVRFKMGKPSFDLKATHMKLGNEQQPYTSSKRADFQWNDPEIGNNEQIKALTKDLRGKPLFNFLDHHFKFGHDPIDYATESNQNYTEKPQAEIGDKGPKPYKNNFKLGGINPLDPNTYISEYNDNMGPKDLPVREAAAEKGRDQVSTVNLGSHDEPKISEHTDKFTEKRISENDTANQQKLLKDLRKTHIQMGKDPNDYGTTYRTEHDDKGVLEKDTTSEAVKKDLRKTHYELGYKKVFAKGLIN